jgi:aspartyl-tRNA(Asn)/glutamyl-tRNA(Gln) amidotransferase subunit B
MKSPEDVRNFLRELMNLLRYTERIVDVGGVVRMDVNISLAGGAKVEIKNINSVRGAYKAIQYEIMRQKNMRKRGATVTQETRGFSEKSMVTVPMRVKETADDYRYIPDPDIPPLLFTADAIEKLPLPETPQSRMRRLLERFRIPGNYAETLVRDKDLADLFEEVAKSADAQLAASWICLEVLRQLNYRGIELSESKLDSGIIAELLSLVSSGAVTENTAKKVLERVIDSGESPKAVVEKEGLGKVDGGGELASAVDAVLAEHQAAAADYRSGKSEALNFLLGQIMRKMRGRADVPAATVLLKEKLG